VIALALWLAAPGAIALAGSEGEADPLADLPITEMPADGSTGTTLAFLASGDGGWSGLGKRVAKGFVAKGVPVVGLNSLRYLWDPKDPDQAGRDLEAILRHYLPAWKKTRVVLIGYSSGADILPFMATRLPPDLLDDVSLVALVGPGEQAAFEFHIGDWLHMAPKGTQYPILPELERLKGKKILCVAGDEEEDVLCPTLPGDLATRVSLPGGHHVGGDYDKLVETILDEIPPEE